ncbi:MAG: phytanoyl-CoA dioxygenase family protein [Sulfurovum sp.]|nr:phytanoyl-CoA dioxygenase family protein [Sulfurovum sp.]
MQLTKEQLAQFHNDGYIVLRGFLDVKICDNLLRIAQIHLDTKIEPIETEIGYDSRDKEYRTSVTDYSSHALEEHVTVRRLRQVYNRDALFNAWMENEKIRPILQKILEDQVVITTAHHNSIMTKMPYYSTATRWHQDRRYWRYSDDNLVSVWLALDSETSENGVLEFIPGSHRIHFEEQQFDEKEYLDEENSLNKVLIHTKVSTDLQKGDVVIFHSLLLHRANKNSTDKAKISFVYTVKGEKTQALKGSRSAEFEEIVLPIL